MMADDGTPLPGSKWTSCSCGRPQEFFVYEGQRYCARCATALKDTLKAHKIATPIETEYDLVTRRWNNGT